MVHALSSRGLWVLLLRMLIVHGNGQHRLARHHSLCCRRVLELSHGRMLVLGALKGVRRGLGRVKRVVAKTVIANRTPHRCRGKCAWAAIQRGCQARFCVRVTVLSWYALELAGVHGRNSWVVGFDEVLLRHGGIRHAAHHSMLRVHVVGILGSVGREAVAVFVWCLHVLAWQRSLHSHSVVHHHLPMWLLTPDVGVVCPRRRRRVVPTGFASSVVDKSAWLMGSALVLDHGCLPAESAVR